MHICKLGCARRKRKNEPCEVGEKKVNVKENGCVKDENGPDVARVWSEEEEKCTPGKMDDEKFLSRVKTGK